VHDDILRTIERVLVAPDTISRVSLAAREILEAVADDKIPDPQKLCLTIDRCVEPVKLWEVISPNAEKYSADVIFDGGFRLPAFIKPGWNVDDFCVGWSNRFGNTVRSIRNALVHARENRMVDVIAPTPENYKKLTPWLPPLRFVAMQCLIFEDR
jgi:hypothetical protein